LQNKDGFYCCARADGHPLEDGEWDIKDNHYRVFLEGEWIDVPDDAVISGPNKFGKAIVWFRNYPGRVTPDTRILCLECRRVPSHAREFWLHRRSRANS